MKIATDTNQQEFKKDAMTKIAELAYLSSVISTIMPSRRSMSATPTQRMNNMPTKLFNKSNKKRKTAKDTRKKNR